MSYNQGPKLESKLLKEKNKSQLKIKHVNKKYVTSIEKM